MNGHLNQTKRTRACKISEVEHVRKYLTFVKEQLNGVRYYPPLNAYRYTVALALYSKALTVAEAILVLLDADFCDEAFGMTRTLVDIYFTMRYIANRDTEERAELFYRFIAKDVQGRGGSREGLFRSPITTRETGHPSNCRNVSESAPMVRQDGQGDGIGAGQL